MCEYLSRAPTLYNISPNLKTTNNIQVHKIRGIYKVTCNTCNTSDRQAQPQTGIPRTYKINKTK